MGAWLLVAAEGREFAGIMKRCPSARRLGWPVAFACEVRREGERWLLVANGPGPRLAAGGVDVAVGREKDLEGVISTGFCGALDEGLMVGDIVAATRVGAVAARPPGAGKPFRLGEVLSMDHVAVSVAEKARLRSTGAIAVEMEAAGVAERASRLDLPFWCVRAVSDDARSSLPLDFNLLRSQDGRFSRSRILSRALQQPFRALPGLLALDRNCRRAAERLGEFLVDCRF